MGRIGKDKRPAAGLPSHSRIPRLLKTTVVVWVVVLLTANIGVLGSDNQVTVSGFDADQTAVIQSALARFERASMQIPRTHIRFSKGAGPCTRRGQAADTWPIALAEVCVVVEDVVVHELAHIWAFHNLDSEERQAWNKYRGATTWRSRQHPWDARGSEHAADILTWYLYWSEFAAPRHRIGGERSPDRFIADVEWLLQAGNAADALQVYSSRAPQIEVRYEGAGRAS